MVNLIELKSVGSLLNLENGIIYPKLQNGKPDMSMAVYLIEVEILDEYYKKLSVIDALHIAKSISLTKKYDIQREKVFLFEIELSRKQHRLWNERGYDIPYLENLTQYEMIALYDTEFYIEDN
tara:strand:+ start:130 stop:498 length:369 start_codon:yes stop_codon:yes gene_type:complete